MFLVVATDCVESQEAVSLMRETWGSSAFKGKFLTVFECYRKLAWGLMQRDV